MSNDIDHMVVASMGPADVDSLISDALRVLRECYPGAHTYTTEIRIRRRIGSDPGGHLYWMMEVDNERGSGESRADALRELQEAVDEKRMLPEYAARVANVLRTVPADRWTRENVVRRAQEILETEGLRGRR